MARLAQNWVETNFSAAVAPIDTLEKDFSNGYKFLKILEDKRIISEEELQDASDGNLPKIVMKNMAILTKALKSINIALSKQQIADIISEQPGGAADLIMSLKKKFEGFSTSPKWRNDSYKKSIRSLKPKPIRKLEGNDDQDTQFFSTIVGKGANFREVDSYAQQKRYHEFDHDEEQRYKERLERDHHRTLNNLADKRQQFLETLDRRIEQRLETTTVGKKNWRANDMARKKRLTRHLQYELTIAEQIKEKRDWENTLHREDQRNGIEDYENNLMRNGLGGEDTAASTGGDLMLPTSENSESYLNRIEEKVQTHWPTNGEISDFMQTLEKRTREVRLARQEKARRKRRLQVEQKAALLEIGGTSAPPSRSNSMDASALMSTERPEEKAARKSREYDELTQRAAVQRGLQVEEGEKRIRIFAERQRMMAYESNDWQAKKEAVLAAQAARAEEKKARTFTTCKAIVIEFIADLFPADASQPIWANSVQEAENAGEDDIHHTHLMTELRKIIQTPSDGAMIPTYSRVARSRVADLYPSVALLASDIARWKRIDASPAEETVEGGASIVFGRVNSFRESALEIFQQFQIYSESTNLTPFALSLSSEYLPLLNSLTCRFQEAKTFPQQCVYLVAGGALNLSQEVLGVTCDWLGGPDLFALFTVSTAIELACKLRQTVAAADGTADPTLVRFENLFNLWDIRSAVDSALFPEISFHASRVVGDIFDILSRLSASDSSSHTPSSDDLTAFRFSDTTLAILLAQILWLRDYVCSAVYSINGTTPLTPIVLASFHFGSPDRVVVMKVFDWFLRGGSRVNLPEGDEAIAGEVQNEIATVPIEKGKKAAKPQGKGKKDKRDTTELIQPSSPIRGVIWLQSVEGEMSDASMSPPPTEGLSNPAQLYATLVKQKAILNSAQSAETVESVNAAAQLFVKELNAPLVWLGLGSSSLSLSHPFNAIEAIAATVLTSLSKISPTQEEASAPSGVMTEEIVSSLTRRREEMLSTPQRIWLNHVMKVNSINFDAIRGVLKNMREGIASEADGLSGMILTLLLRIQQIRSEMLREKAVQSNNFKLSEGKWKETCLEWREALVLVEKSSRKSMPSKGNAPDAMADLQMRSRELECELGDLIDLRHQRWTKQLEKLGDRLVTLLRVMCQTVTDIVIGLERTIAHLVDRNLTDSLELTALLETAGYRDFPWTLKTDLKKGGAVRVEGNRLRDEIRNQISQLLSCLDELQGSGASSGDMASLSSLLLAQLERLPTSTTMGQGKAEEGTDAPNSLLQSAVIHEIKTEGCEMLVTLFRSLSECLISMKGVSHAVLADLNDYSLQRNQYEHRLLREWVTELRESFSSSPSEGSSPYGTAITFMNSYYYGVSDDPEHDGVPRSSLSNRGLVDMGEMVLPIRQVRLLSLEMFLERASSSSLESFDPFEFLTAAIQRLFENSESLPLVWRQINKLHRLVDAICESHPAAAQSAEQFSVELVMRLLYAALPLAIPSAYILKLGRKICESTLSSLSSDSPCVVKLSAVLSLLEKDKGLSQGWWPSLPSLSASDELSGGNSQHHVDLVLFVIEAIALTAATPETAVLTNKADKQTIESVDVHLDKLLLALCYGPSLSNESVTTLQQSLCLSYDSASIGEMANPPPQFLYESMTKLLVVGLHLMGRPPLQEEESGEREPSLHETVYGPMIHSPQALLAWLGSLNQLPSPLFDGMLRQSEPILCRQILDTLRGVGGRVA